MDKHVIYGAQILELVGYTVINRDFLHSHAFDIHRPITLYAPSESKFTIYIQEACSAITAYIGSRSEITLVYNPSLTNMSQLSLVLILEQESIVNSWLFLLHSTVSLFDLEIVTQDKKSLGSVKLLAVCDKDNHLTIRSRQEHSVENAQSSLLVKCIAQHNAFIKYEGSITIDRVAAGTKACQRSQMMLIGSDARAIAIPALEVLNHEVECSHGAAVGYIPDDVLWYIQSRGLDPEVAHALITQGFSEEILADIPLNDIKQKLRGLLRKESI
ncbi:MAG TPA: SufD family Fe-S cluster assembly protein [Candidatus Babeliaceae bacterium]|nr:SufD family Fe-S cluster assembly protein [Candidatus Babeliaceae bacterium]